MCIKLFGKSSSHALHYHTGAWRRSSSPVLLCENVVSTAASNDSPEDESDFSYISKLRFYNIQKWRSCLEKLVEPEKL